MVSIYGMSVLLRPVTAVSFIIRLPLLGSSHYRPRVNQNLGVSRVKSHCCVDFIPPLKASRSAQRLPCKSPSGCPTFTSACHSSMKFWDAISSVLCFRSIPTTVLLVLVYATVFTTVLVTDELPDVPKNQDGLNISQAYADLYQVNISLFCQSNCNSTFSGCCSPSPIQFAFE